MRFLNRKLLISLFFITLTCTFSFGSKAFAVEDGRDNWVHIFIAAGPLFGLGSVRAGVDSWEFGLMNSMSFGVAKFFTKNGFYGGMGLIVDNNVSPGFFGAVGYDLQFLTMLSLRLEFNTSASIEGFMDEGALLGVALHF